jgi:S1-C subfamily serine protease
MTKTHWIIASGLACMLLSTAASAQEPRDETPQDTERELAEAEARMRDAQQRLEAAADEVARLSAQRVGPVMRQVFFDRGVPLGRPLLGLIIDDAERGVRVTGVTPNGPADEAGIISGDLLVAIDGQPLAATDDATATQLLMSRLALVDPGETVALSLERGEQSLSLDVRARDMRSVNFTWGPFGAPGVRVSGPLPNFDVVLRDFAGRRWRSMELVELTPGLGEYFGTQQGLLVVRAPQDEALQLLDGDVILSIGGRTPTSAEHAMRILGSFEPGERLELTIMRQQRRETIALELPEEPDRVWVERR